MAPLTEALSDLTMFSRNLNEESNSVNETISSVEEAINQARPGIEVWARMEILPSDHAADAARYALEAKRPTFEELRLTGYW